LTCAGKAVKTGCCTHPRNERSGSEIDKPAVKLVLRIAIISSMLAIGVAQAPLTRAVAASETAPGGPIDAGSRRMPHYVGTVYCYACHQELALEFAKTRMGRLFLIKPENDLERLGCEGCHGPASNHAESGGGLGVGGMAEFRIGRGQTVEHNNRACLDCHDEAFWHGKTHPMRRMACFDCHVVMVPTSPKFQLAPATAGQNWNSGRTWRNAALFGLLAGAVFGGWRRIRIGRRKS
jgi:hypothetical protein